VLLHHLRDHPHILDVKAQIKQNQIKTIYSNDGAFAALTLDHNVITWGHGRYGGNPPDYVRNELFGVETIIPLLQGFRAILKNGFSVEW
jgi:hypothetical protein